MNQELLNQAACILEMVKKAGAKECAVYLSRGRFIEISYRNRRPENIREAASKGLYLEFYVDGRYSGQSTSDLRESALPSFIANAVATTRLLAEDPYRSLPDPRYYQGRATIDLQRTDPTYDQFTPEQRHAAVKAIEGACLHAGGERVISVTAEEYDGQSEGICITSNGFEGYSDSSIYYLSAEITIQDEGDRRPENYYYSMARHRWDLLQPDQVGLIAARRTLDLLGAKKIPTEILPIIVENQNVARLLGGFVAALYGRNIQQKRSFLADKKDQKVGSDWFTLLDDPHIVKGFGSRLFDGDGFATKKRTILAAGVLKEFYVDWYYSRKLGWEPTTGGSSNLILPPGTRTVKQIMQDLGRGILITGFLGGNSNSTTGDFSVGIQGKLFENGVPVQAVAEMNIADNHLKFWSKLAEAANDPWENSSWRMPSLVFTDVVAAGV